MNLTPKGLSFSAMKPPFLKIRSILHFQKSVGSGEPTEPTLTMPLYKNIAMILNKISQIQYSTNLTLDCANLNVMQKNREINIEMFYLLTKKKSVPSPQKKLLKQKTSLLKNVRYVSGVTKHIQSCDALLSEAKVS